MVEMDRPFIGLTLSGGGARGLAHIGVLKVLEREGIPIDCISGASMGGILAAAYAAGYSALDLEDLALDMTRRRRLVHLVDFTPPTRGLLAGRKLRAYLAQFLPPELNFADLRLPLALEAVDLDAGREVALTQGSVLRAALATSAFPGVLPPVAWQGRRLVDGGLLDNLPIDLVRGLGAEVVIAVNVGSMPNEPDELEPGLSSHLPSFMRTALDAVWLVTNARTWARLEEDKPDILIHPHLPPDIGTFSSFTRAAEIIAIGEEAANRAVGELLEHCLPGPRMSPVLEASAAFA